MQGHKNVILRKLNGNHRSRLIQGIFLAVVLAAPAISAKSPTILSTPFPDDLSAGITDELFDYRTFSPVKLSLNEINTPLFRNVPKQLSIEKRPQIQRKLSKFDLYNLKAEDFYNQGLKKRSIKIWELILKLSPKHHPSMNNLARAYFNERRFKPSETMFLKLSLLDGSSWYYPNARFLAAMAHYKQYGDLTADHGVLLDKFLKRRPNRYRNEAERLKLIAMDKVDSNLINRTEFNRFRENLQNSPRNIIHFWAEWCAPCLTELSELFKFRAQHPDIQYLIVSVDGKESKKRADRRINQIYAPFKLSKVENIRFIFDPKKLLWNRFIPSKDSNALTVPRTVFLEKLDSVAYIPRKIDWRSIDVANLWKEKDKHVLAEEKK